MSIRFVLPNKEVVWLRYLKTKELRNLLLVRTTVEQARRILKRNTKALDELRTPAAPYREFPNGCPHCAGPCDTCRWTQVSLSHDDPARRYSLAACTEQPFAGYAYSYVDRISLDPGSIIVYSGGLDDTEAVDTDSDFRIAELFLLGHIEWARIVIRLGGVRAPAGWSKTNSAGNPWRN